MEKLPFRLIGIVHHVEAFQVGLNIALAYPKVGLGLMLRDPHHRAESVRALADTVRQHVIPENLTLITNGCRVQGIEWQHLTGEELRGDRSRELSSAEAFGCSIHSIDELTLAERLGPRYLMLSPIFPTTSKPGHQPLGLSALSAIADRTITPIITLGGITSAEKMKQCLQAGAYGVAGITLLNREHRPALHKILAALSTPAYVT